MGGTKLIIEFYFFLPVGLRANPKLGSTLSFFRLSFHGSGVFLVIFPFFIPTLSLLLSLPTLSLCETTLLRADPVHLRVHFLCLHYSTAIKVFR